MSQLYLTEPLTVNEIAKATDNGANYLTVQIAVDLERIACSSESGTLDGLNEIADEEIGHVLCDIRYRPVGVEGNKVIIEVTGDASDVLSDADDEEDEE